MNTVSLPECSSCGEVLGTNHTGPCPKCGNTGKTYRVRMKAVAEGVASLSWKHTREYYERHPVLLSVVICITLGSPFLGLVIAGWGGVIVGLIVALLAFFLGVHAITRVREVTKGS